MRRTVRIFATVGPAERLGAAIAAMPAGVRRTLVQVAGRRDLPLVSGSWHDDTGGCLVANAVACAGDTDDPRTLDLRMLDAFPQMSSRDLNTLIVAWDEATEQAGVVDDAGMRDLLRRGLRLAGVPLDAAPAPGISRAGSPAPDPPVAERPAPAPSTGDDTGAGVLAPAGVVSD